MFKDFSGQPLPIIFPERIDFLEMREQMPYADVLSAGHITYKGGTFVVSGGSKALGLQVKGEDATLIAEKIMREPGRT